MLEARLHLIAENEHAFISQDYKKKVKSSSKSPWKVIYTILIHPLNSKMCS